MTPALAAAIEVVTASGPFWSSETFWAATGVVAGAGIGAAGVYATRRAAFPKRRLVYSFSSSSLVQRHQRNVSANVLHIRLGERELHNPRLVSLRLENTGRRDISSAQFDQGNPLRIVLGLPVVELVSMAAEPPSALGLSPGGLEDHGMSIRPGRLGAGEAITYTLLVDGDPSFYRLTHALIDVTVKEKFPPKTDG
ncbi:hypothetical protein YWIDRAFT_01834 [Streptomyces sp. SceaMP-e96]|uniref:hypothetical protein n=1 Tax=unclassified Streptomyces TaxID=2593676 RepID=UPI000823BBDB|nr:MULTISPECIES: hypothetical protein [unclassified Streptomyces]MYT12564.1 hypothetical protein [Streptomyces sp. SID4951]SCK37341.1 hypothetical protein YWIDRAFT_01834 [Streptomyces sp. SceaMP-e96]